MRQYIPQFLEMRKRPRELAQKAWLTPGYWGEREREMGGEIKNTASCAQPENGPAGRDSTFIFN